MRSLPVLAVLVALLAAPPPAKGRGLGAVEWRRPVAGAVTRGFSYGADPFRAGWHRGADFAAGPGAVVRAACGGRVVTTRAGGVGGTPRSGGGVASAGAAGSGGVRGVVVGAAGSGGGVVTLRCGLWRVTHLPLATVSVRAGATVRAGARLGTLAASPAHDGLHLGVRQASDRFGYVDPLPFLEGGGDLRGPPAAPPIGSRPHPSRRIPELPPADLFARVRVPAATPARSLAPWPAWLGLALVLFGAFGGGAGIRLRRRRARVAMPAGEAVP